MDTTLPAPCNLMIALCSLEDVTLAPCAHAVGCIVRQGHISEREIGIGRRAVFCNSQIPEISGNNRTHQ